MLRLPLGFTPISPQSPPALAYNNTKDDFSVLSDEIILHIFGYLRKQDLANCNSTSRRFRHLCLDETLWKRVDLGGKPISAQLLHMFIDRGIEYLRLARTTISGKFYPRPPPSTPAQLRYLDLSMVDCGDDEAIIIMEILQRCTKLVAVSLERCTLNSKCLLALAKNTELKILNLCMARGITAHELLAILTSCRQLEELNVAWSSLDRSAVTILRSNAPSSILRLNLAGCRGDALFDEDIIELCAHCPNLVELDVSDSSELTYIVLQAAAQMLPNLSILSASRCYKIDPLAFTTMPPKSLKELNVFNNINEASLSVFENMLPDGVALNATAFSTIARPTVGIRRTSIWGHRVRDD